MRSFRVIAGLAAAALVAVPAFVLPQWINGPVEGAVASLRADDQANAAPLAFPPVVAIVVPNGHDSRTDLYCETLCQRLLFNGAASRVIVADSPPPGRASAISPTAYWIERRDTCPQPWLARWDIVWPDDFRQRRGDGRKGAALARVAAGECLVHEKAQIEEAGITIAYRKIKNGDSPLQHSWSLTLDTVDASRLEVVDAGGRVLYRRTEVKAEPLSVPLRITTAFGFLTTVTYAGWARVTHQHAPIGPNGRDVLPALLGAAARPPEKPELL